MSGISYPDGNDSARWRTLYRIAGLMMLITVVLFRRNFGAELAVSNGFGILDIPSEPIHTALDWFAVLQEDWIVGLYMLEVLDLVNFLMVGLMFVALYGVLKRISPGAMTAALVACLLGVALILITDRTFSMLSLSRQHAAATSSLQRSSLEATGETLLAIDNTEIINSGPCSQVGLFLVLLAGAMVSALMLKSNGTFSRATGIIGLIANGVNICIFPMMILVPSLYYLPTPLSAPFRVAWFVMVGLRLWRLGRRLDDADAGQFT